MTRYIGITGCACHDMNAVLADAAAPAADPRTVAPVGEISPNRLVILRAMGEAEWQAKVRAIATRYGWTSYHTRNSKGSDHGWPDLVLAHASQRRTVFVELKRETGKLTEAQRTWLTHLTRCGFETAMWRPRDEDEVIAVLGPQKRVTAWGRDGAA